MKLLLTILVICLITLVSVEKSIAEDLNGANKTITTNSGSAWTTAYTNTSATAADLIVQPTSDLTEATSFSGQLTGNLRFVVHLSTNQDNGSRLVLNNASNTFTGGLYIEQGTVRVDNYAYIGGENGSKQIDMLHGSLMTNQTFEGYTFNMTAPTSTRNRGAIRLSGGDTNFKAYITGTGSLEIVNDGAVTLTNTSNDYLGNTYIGNMAWRSTTAPAVLNLGASGVLPDTTVVVFGHDGSSGAGYTMKCTTTLDMNGYNETVAGIFNSDGKGVITSTSAATLTLNLPSGSSQSYAGTITDNVSLVITGSGTQTLSKAPEYTGSTTIETGTLELSAGGTLNNLSGGSIGENDQIIPGTLTVNGDLTLNNSKKTKYIGAITADSIKKTGDGTLQLYSTAENMVEAASLVVSSGRLDMQEYFKGALAVGEKLDPENYLTAIFSPGNSVGSLEITGDFTLNPGSTLLLEFDETGSDSLLVTGTTKFEEGSIITLALDEGASVSPNQQVSFQLPPEIATFDTAQLSYPSYLTGVSYNPTTGVLSASVDANAVPEPSTWALLILGAAGLLYVRKRNK